MEYQQSGQPAAFGQPEDLEVRGESRAGDQTETAHGDAFRQPESDIPPETQKQPENGLTLDKSAKKQPENAETAETGSSEKQSEKKAGRKKEKKKGKAGKNAASADQIGTNKGVETMFRNAVRSEMELLALAATKANIMISLNGFIVSALMISGAFIFSSSPEFLIPASTFMVTAAASIVFALLSASPERIGRLQAFREWIKDLFRRKAGLSDFKERVWKTENNRFFGDEANVLIYEDRVKLPREEHWQKIQGIMNDREQVYRKMSDHLYWLGLLADKQFKYINLSYAVFRWGLLASLAAFIGVKAVPSLATPQQNNLAELRTMGINMFNGVYEPSAAQQLPDGRIMIAEDEPNHAFSIISIDANGHFVEDEALDTRIIKGFKRKLNDLEAMTRDDEGFVYAMTSHSRNRKGQRSPDREHLMRFKVQGGDIIGLTSYDGLSEALEKDKELHDLIRGAVGDDADVVFDEINIEGLAYDPVKKRLVLGFRDPEFNNMALIAFIANPKEMMEKNAKPVFDEVAILDIDGGGIRSLNYDPVLKAYIIANEVKGDTGEKSSTLWGWSGNPKDEPKKINLPNLHHMTNVEAVDSVNINGQQRLLLMADEGDAKKNMTAKYMLVDYNQIGRD